jgi:hypothetical protein
MAAKIARFGMNAAAFLARVRALSALSENVVFTSHARTRMRQRRISDLQVLEVLRRGTVAEGPALDIYGNWKATLRKAVAGEIVHVAAALEKGVVVITVY